MQRRSLFYLLLLVAAVATPAAGDPASDLRELDRQLKEGLITEAEHARRWSEVIQAATRAPRETRVPRLEKPSVALRAPQRLSNEFALSGGISAIDSTALDESLLEATAQVGRFITTDIQLSLALSYAYGTIDGIDRETFSALVVADYHFTTGGRFVPFAGGGAGYARLRNGSDDADDWVWTVHMGVKQHLARDTALKYQLGYIDHADSGLRGVRASLGVSFLF